jgi:hypothetical protein
LSWCSVTPPVVAGGRLAEGARGRVGRLMRVVVQVLQKAKASGVCLCSGFVPVGVVGEKVRRK